MRINAPVKFMLVGTQGQALLHFLKNSSIQIGGAIGVDFCKMEVDNQQYQFWWSARQSEVTSYIPRSNLFGRQLIIVFCPKDQDELKVLSAEYKKEATKIVFNFNHTSSLLQHPTLHIGGADKDETSRAVAKKIIALSELPPKQSKLFEMVLVDDDNDEKPSVMNMGGK